jgi:Transposase IS4
VLYLLQLLTKRPIESPYVVWLDNLFSSTKLFEFLRKEGFGATGTARTNSGIYSGFVEKKKLDKAKDLEPWGKLYTEPTVSNNMIQYAWKDNALVLFLSTTSNPVDSIVIRNRKRPSSTSTSAKIARKVFGSEPRKDLPIPKFVDDYNYSTL